MTFLVDYNLDGYAIVFLGVLTKLGWLDLLPIQFVTLKEAGLAMDSSDRTLWDYAQKHQMMILTANRNRKGKGSLEQVMIENNTATSFPVVTIGDLKRLNEFDYRDQCVYRLVEIALDAEKYMGAGRLFIP
ncbi:MAG: DUF5615 family PIN-like protein [Cyanobacteria bacterium J06634_6]